ncbi:MAG TPA: OsmC family protein [Terriglobales bacterium]|nr:OsmC family protein [Terriglobales bacterium]
MEPRYFYHASAHWSLHERGVVRAGEEIPETFTFSSPPEFGGQEGVWTPEHMLLAAVGSCFVATFRGVARASKLEFHDIDVQVEGIIEKEDGSLRFTKVIVRPEVRIVHEADRVRTGLLLEKAERLCLITHSLSSAVVLQTRIEAQEPAPELVV